MKPRRELTKQEQLDLNLFLSKAVPLCAQGKPHIFQASKGSMMFIKESKDIKTKEKGPLVLPSGNLIIVDEYWGNIEKLTGQYIICLEDIDNPIFKLDYRSEAMTRGLEKNDKGEFLHKNNIKECMHAALSQEGKKYPWRGPESFNYKGYNYVHIPSCTNMYYLDGREYVIESRTGEQLLRTKYVASIINPFA
ncbi:MAG: hypothetical protein PHD81_02595 [Candidatus Nanoarchaeia archaeon]|nr:hypothetical protein [Candidatus Nanoarchaeia archaeon]MDD5587975.1 hypothetical protein [Candidatus Nanoarchaeia archaeon]